MSVLLLVGALICTGMAVHRIFFPEHWKAWYSKEFNVWDDDELEAYRQMSAFLDLLLASLLWYGFGQSVLP